jgi:hypothetical protein
VAPKRNVFRGENVADPTIKKSKHFIKPNLKYQLKNKYPPLAKNVTKGYQSVVTQSFILLPAHVVSLETPFVSQQIGK